MTPARVRIREVGPRDGFQNEPEVVPTDEKVRLIDLLARTGLTRLEVTSFVRADVIPQLADAEEVLDRIDPPQDVAVSVLIPNEKGLENALRRRERFQEINVFLSASETHNRKNVNRSIEESLTGLEACSRAPAARGCAARASSPSPSAAPTRATSRPSACSRSPGGCVRGRRRGRLRRHHRDGEPGAGARLLPRRPRGARRGRRADRALPQHARPGPRQRVRGARGGGRLVRVELRRARRLPRAARGDRQHRHRGPRLDAARDGHRDGHLARAAGRGRALGAGDPRAPARLARPDRGAGEWKG